MKNKYIIISLSFFFIFISFLFVIKIKASNVEGVIDPVLKYAKIVSSKARINMGVFQGESSLKISDSKITGFAWGENIGWINFAPVEAGVFNDGEGNLSGYASSEYGGWVDFSEVKINSSGEFTGYANSKNFGKLSFNCSNDNSCTVEDYKVATDWRPISIRNDGSVRPIPPPKLSSPPEFISTTTKNDVDIETKNDNLNSTNNTVTDNQNLNSKNTEKEIPKVKVFDVNTSQEVSVNEVPATDNKTKPIIYVNSSQESVKKDNSFSKIVEDKTKEIKDEAINITSTPVVNISTKAVTTAGVAGGGTAIVSSLVSSLVSFSEIFLLLARLWSIILSSLGLRKKRESWGTVYDSVTKQPLDPAYVMLKDKFGKVIATSITDLDGRYGFMVQPGMYHIVASKTNYTYPSKKLHGKNSDELYDNLYFGEDIEITNNKLVNKNIPMDPEKFDWNEFEKRNKKVMKFHSPFSKILAKTSNILFLSGLILSIILLILKPDIFNIAILSVYFVLFVLRKANFKTKSYGLIIDSKTREPLSFAIIRVFMKESPEKEAFHRVADELGRYYCLLPGGNYYITIEKKNVDGSYSKVYRSEILDLRNGILKKEFIV